MRLKIIGGVLSFLLISLSILLFIEDNPKTKIIVSPKIYSIVKSSDNEKFNITLLVSNLDSYYFNQDYISSISLSSNNDEIIPLVLSEIKKSQEQYIYNDDVYYYMTLELKLGFQSDDYLISMTEAHLDITYKNAFEINLFVGEFNYYFYDEINTDFSLNNLLSTHTLINDIDTASGLLLNLGNLTDYNITISKVELGTSNVVANNYYLSEIYSLPQIDENPEEILNIENYNYNNHSDYLPNNILLRKNNEIMIYVPFSYTGDIGYLYRFYVEVHYVVNNEEKVYIIDDFPYINTTNYKEELESRYYFYEYDN